MFDMENYLKKESDALDMLIRLNNSTDELLDNINNLIKDNNL